MTVFVCRNEEGGPQLLVAAADHLTAAERYAEAVGLPRGGTTRVAWRAVRTDEAGVAFVAHGGTVFASEDGFVFVPPPGTPWVVTDTFGDFPRDCVVI